MYYVSKCSRVEGKGEREKRMSEVVLSCKYFQAEGVDQSACSLSGGEGGREAYLDRGKRRIWGEWRERKKRRRLRKSG